MTWQTYYDAETEGIEEVERETDRAWLLLLLWLLLGERHFRRALTPARLRLPVDDAGRWDTTRAAQFQRFRRIAAAQSQRVERRLVLAASGRLDSPSFTGSRRTLPSGGLIHQSIRSAAELRSISWATTWESSFPHWSRYHASFLRGSSRQSNTNTGIFPLWRLR
jgi:hypothetical protein